MTPTDVRPWGWRLVLVAVLILAAWLRLSGLSFGLPAVYNPDEVAIMSRALAFATGDLNPHNFLYPTLYFYVLFAWIGASFVVSWMVGATPSLSAFQTQFFVDPTAVYFAGRALGVACGVATVALVFVLGRRLFGARAGLAAALFLAVAPTSVRDSHYVKHDVPVTLAILGAILAIVALAKPAAGLESGRPADAAGTEAAGTRETGVRRRLLVAGALCGVAFSTHYYAVFLALPLAIAAWQATHDGGRVAVVRAWTRAGLAAALVFFGLSPFLLVEPATAWTDIVANREIVMDRAVSGGGQLFSSAPAYVRMLWNEAIGWPVVLASLAGAFLLAWRNPALALVLAAFPIAFLAFISNTVAASRYLNPVLPFVALTAGYAIGAVPRLGPLPAGLTTVLLAVPGLVLSFALGRFFQQTDTRTLALNAFEKRAPAGSTVLVQPYSVPFIQSKESLEEALRVKVGDPSRASTKFRLRLGLDPYPEPAFRTLFLGEGGLDADKIYLSYDEVSGDRGLEALRRYGVRYVVLKRYNTEDLAGLSLRTLLTAHGTRVVVVSPYRRDVTAAEASAVAPFLHNTDTPYHPALERPGPGIEIWELPDAVWGPSERIVRD
jgi:hypothetical protein